MGYHVKVHAPNSASLAELNTDYILSNGKAAQTHGWWSLWQTRRLLRRQLKASPDAIHFLAEPGPILALGTLPKNEIRSSRCLIVLHGSEIIRWQNPGFARCSASRAIRAAIGIRAVARPIAKLAESTFPSATGKTKAISNALPSKHFMRSYSKQNHERPNGIELDLLSVGRIHRRKGFEQTISALGSMPENTRQKIRFTIAGARKDERYLRELKAYAQENGVSLRVELDVNDKRLAEFYQSSDLFVLTSVLKKDSIEGFGLVYLEAGAYGLPCIGYQTGGVGDAIQDGETGFLIEPGNISALAQAIQRFFDHPELRQQMGHNNYTFATKRDWSKVVEETLEGVV